MKIFKYQAIDTNGNFHNDLIKSTDIKEVEEFLSYVNLEPVSIYKTFFLPIFYRRKNFYLFQFTNKFLFLLKTGLNSLQIIDILRKQNSFKPIRHILNQIYFYLIKGEKLHSSLKYNKELFPLFYISLIQTGEKTSNLELILEKLKKFYEFKINFEKKLQNMLLYPFIVLSLAILLIAFIITYLIPTLNKIFISYKLKMPLVTKILFVSVSFIKNYLFFNILFIFILLSFLWYIYKKNTNFKYKIDKFITKLFKWNYYNNLANIFLILKTSYSAQMPLENALKISADSTNNSYLKNKIKNAISMIEQGMNLTDSFSVFIFDDEIIDLLKTSLIANDLESSFDAIYNTCFEKFSTFINNFITILEPLIIIIIASLIGFLMISILLPLSSLM